MYLNLSDALKHDAAALEARDIIKDCVHCGMCLGTCPTYGVLGDEQDSPRGRIYQIKNMLEGQADLASVQQHLDRCLTCRSCETTCPSGVQYGHLLEWGRDHLRQHHTRAWAERGKLGVLRHVLTRPALFGVLWRAASVVKKALPATYAAKLKPAAWSASTAPAAVVLQPIDLKVIVHQGCVQNTMSPNINQATIRLLSAWGVSVQTVQDGCCGAIAAHTDDAVGARAMAMRNIRVWGELLDTQPKTLVVSNASGCGAQLKEYGHLFKHDEAQAESAQKVSAAVRDVSEVILWVLKQYPVVRDALKTRIAALPDAAKYMAYHEPCTLQHGQKLKGSVSGLLTEIGVRLAPSINTHLCCGSAGTYSITQPELSKQLLSNKINDLKMDNVAFVLSGNIGCISQIASAAHAPVLHWIEWLDAVWAGDERVKLQS